MGKYDDYVEMCENEGTTPLAPDEWIKQRQAEGRSRKAAERATEQANKGIDEWAAGAAAVAAAQQDPTPEPVVAAPSNPTGPDPEDKVTVNAKSLESLFARIDDLENRLAAATTPRDPSATAEAAAAVLPKPPEPWGSNGNYSYGSDTLELELTVEAGHTKMSNGRLINIPDKSVKFTGGSFTTDDPEIRDWLERQPEFNGRGGAKYPARIWRTELLQPGTAVRITDGPKTTVTTPAARYADRPTPLHAKV